MNVSAHSDGKRSNEEKESFLHILLRHFSSHYLNLDQKGGLMVHKFTNSGSTTITWTTARAQKCAKIFWLNFVDYHFSKKKRKNLLAVFAQNLSLIEIGIGKKILYFYGLL